MLSITACWRKKKFKYAPFLLALLCIFTACEPEAFEEQRPFDPEAGATPVTVTLNARTVQEFPVDGSGFSRERLGALNDGTFGKTLASLAFQFNLPEDEEWNGFDENDPVSSAYMGIEYYGPASYFGEERSHMTLKAYMLDEVLLDSNYRTNTEFPVTGENYSTFSDELIDPAETILRIPLTQEFSDIITSLPEESFDTDNTLRNAFYGLKIEPEPLTGQRRGGIYYFDLRSNLSALTFITESNDTIRFPVGNDAVRVNLFNHDHSTAEFSGQLDADGDFFETVYLQPMAGTKAHIQIPPLHEVLESDNAIHRAEVIIPYESKDLYPPPPRLLLFESGDNLDNLIIEGFNYPHYGGQINTGEGHYRFIITPYIQTLHKKYVDDPGFENNGLNLIIPNDDPAIANPLIIPVSGDDTPLKLRIYKSRTRSE